MKLKKCPLINLTEIIIHSTSDTPRIEIMEFLQVKNTKL